MTKTRDLADLGGGFIQAGTGAVQRTVESKLQDVVSVKDFGAKGDVTTDDTAAFNAWLAALVKATVFGGEERRAIGFIPAGTYKISSTLTLPDAPLIIRGEGNLYTQLYFTQANGDCISVTKGDVELSDFQIISPTSGRVTGNGITVNNPAVSTNTTRGGRIERIAILLQPGDGVKLTNREQLHVEDVNVVECGGAGFDLTFCSWCTFVNCRARNCAGSGLVTDNQCQQLTFTNQEALSCGSPLMSIDGQSLWFVNPDCEYATAEYNPAGSTVGLAVTGFRHSFIGGYFGNLNTGVTLTLAQECKFDRIKMLNSVAGSAFQYDQLGGSNSKNTFYISGTGSNFADPMGVSGVASTYGSEGDLIYNGSTSLEYRNSALLTNKSIVQSGNAWNGNRLRLDPLNLWVDGSSNLRIKNGTPASDTDGNAVALITSGTFTPTVRFNGVTTGITYTAQSGSYTRIGNVVTFRLYVQLSSKGGLTGNFDVSGLPVAAPGIEQALPLFFTGGLGPLGDTMLTARILAGQDVVQVFKAAGAGAVRITDADVSDTFVLSVAGSYLV